MSSDLSLLTVSLILLLALFAAWFVIMMHL